MPVRSLPLSIYRQLLYPAYLRLPDPVYRFVDTLVYRNDCNLGGPGYYREYLKWRWHISTNNSVGTLPHKLTVILLSFKRVRNIQLIVQGLLKLPFVETIIVSNNNPEYRIEQWIHFKDPRVRLINQPKPTPPGIRFELARGESGKYFLTIDDDVFLYSHQLTTLAKALMDDSLSPCGIQGENREFGTQNNGQRSEGWHSGISGFDGRVDVINRVYAFTREHLDEMYQLAARLNIEVGALANGEDLLLSFSGYSKPRLIKVGRILGCLSENREGIATWTSRAGFFAERRGLYDKLLAAKCLAVR